MSTFDYIIIGAGSAGCVLANRLSEDPSVHVLLIEAGKKDSKMEIQIPAAFSKLFHSEFDWGYQSTPSPFSGDRRHFLPRGKVLGGCSSVNAMIYIRGNALDYDHWFDLGNQGWSYEEMLPFFKKGEGHVDGEHPFHGGNGLLTVSHLRDPMPTSHAFISAGEELAIPINPDFNGNYQEGLGFYQVTQRKGKRCSASDAFLKPIRSRPNLKILTRKTVTRILIEEGTAVGVEYREKHHVQQVRCTREVLVSAGAYNSPQLLMLSGIGPADHLKSHGIEVTLDLPGVGQHLQDHYIVPMVFHNRDKRTLENAERLPSLLNYLFWTEGPLSSNVAEAGGFIKTRKELPAPDIQFHFAPGYFFNHGLDRPKSGHGFSIGPTLLQPESIGSIQLQSADPLDAPLIDHNYLSDARDVETLKAGMKVAYEIAHSEAMSNFFDGYYLPNKHLESDRELDRHIRTQGQTLYHPTGTCKMGSDEMAVVDEQLRVHGVQHLRIVDASIMPQIVRGNTNAPTIAIAEKAAEMITSHAKQTETRPATMKTSG
ncbi:GMC family oxidoreductase N-terminal domain-containing protein [Pontibacter sp. G13]|uniref:GMC family oxidoreductase n=1 Tax=Pontibacter sp. G13 TaxID=3074898 RepID=UPI00288B3CF0|nr:GMC family oxidoreductase N-terminal domain-containing protein [Pontibacter sp. G13]WNJ18538.1 GMC family oxidoreductase N-terminal domain-containing protein [Pontibacter sp. G13]